MQSEYNEDDDGVYYTLTMEDDNILVRINKDFITNKIFFLSKLKIHEILNFNLIW